MGLKDYFARKKFQQELLFVSNIMKCDSQQLTPPDLLSIMSFIFSSKKDVVKHMYANKTCEIETYIFACFYVTYSCIMDILSDKNKQLCLSMVFINYANALSHKYKIKQEHIREIITSRSRNYEECLHISFEEVCDSYCELLSHAESTDDIESYNEESSILIEGFDTSFEKKIEVTAFLKGLESACKSTIEDTVDFFNSLP